MPGPTDISSTATEGAGNGAAAPPPPPAAAGSPEPEPDQVSAQIDQKQMPAQEGPMPVRPMRRGGLAGIVDEMRDAISGTSTSQIYQDDQGNKYIQHPDLTSGQKWLRVVGTAVHGAAAGLANGQGPGGGARAFAAGVNAGDQEAAARQAREQHMSEEVKQAQLDKYNFIKLQHDVASQEFALQRMKVTAQEQDVEFAQKQIDREHTLNSADLGIYKDPADLARVREQNPNFWKDVYAGNIVSIPEIAPDGTRQGIHVFMRTPGIGSQLAPKGTRILQFVPGEKPGDPPHLAEQTLSVPATNSEVDTYNAAAMKQYQAWFKDKTEAENKAADTANKDSERKDRDAENPSKVDLNKAHADEARAAAEKDRADAQKAGEETKTLQSVNGGAQPGGQSVVDVIGQGRATLQQLRFLIGKNPALMNAVAQKYPDFDGSKVDAYLKQYANFTSGKAGIAMNSGSTALQHLNELYEMNSVASHIPGSAAWRAYHDKARTVAQELGQFYGTSTIPEIEGIYSELTPNLPNNRQSAIKTQAGSMIDKMGEYLNQWKNAAPSKAYEAQMPGLSDRAKAAYKFFDPKRAQEFEEELRPSSARVPEPQQQASATPPGATQEVHQGGPNGPLIGHIVNGQYVPLEGGK